MKTASKDCTLRLVWSDGETELKGGCCYVAADQAYCTNGRHVTAFVTQCLSHFTHRLSGTFALLHCGITLAMSQANYFKAKLLLQSVIIAIIILYII